MSNFRAIDLLYLRKGDNTVIFLHEATFHNWGQTWEETGDREKKALRGFTQGSGYHVKTIPARVTGQ